MGLARVASGAMTVFLGGDNSSTRCKGKTGMGVCGRRCRWNLRKCDLKFALKIFVRTLHGSLTVAVASTLLYYKTGLREAIESGNVIYWLSFFTAAIFSLIMYYVSCLMDPGYVPIPEESDEDGKCEIEDEGEVDEEAVNDDVSLMPKERVALRECGFCGCEQPLRARHCEDCNRCIRKFDHHCPWLETCVGEGNHRFFLMFVVSKAIVTSWATVIIWGSLEFHIGWTEWLKTNAVLLIDLCITVTVTVILTILGGLHTYLMAINSTTWEMMSRERISYLKNLDGDLNPFHEGYCCNIYRFLCAKTSRQWDRLYNRNISSKFRSL